MQPGPALVEMEGAGPRVRRLRAPNPSPMTFTGTNSYLVGAGDVAVIDPGPADARHLQALLAALEPGERIAQIIVTHAHVDHSALALRLGGLTGAPVLAFGGRLEGGRAASPDAGGGHAARGAGGSDDRDDRAPGEAAGADGAHATGGDGIDRGFRPTRALADGEEVEGDGWRLRVIHTPGHLGDHICLAAGDLCFTGDHVMGWSSSIVSPPEGRMGDYMASLGRLMPGRWRLFLPGHGDPVADPAARLAELAAHRRAREAEVLRSLAAGPSSVAALTRTIYADTPAALHHAAGRNVLAHLEDLVERGRVARIGRPGQPAEFHILRSPEGPAQTR